MDYMGTLAICPECGSAVAVDRKQLHLDALHPEPLELEELEGGPVVQVVDWDDSHDEAATRPSGL